MGCAGLAVIILFWVTDRFAGVLTGRGSLCDDPRFVFLRFIHISDSQECFKYRVQSVQAVQNVSDGPFQFLSGLQLVKAPKIKRLELVELFVEKKGKYYGKEDQSLLSRAESCAVVESYGGVRFFDQAWSRHGDGVA